jgi:hypothetical protein
MLLIPVILLSLLSLLPLLPLLTLRIYATLLPCLLHFSAKLAPRADPANMVHIVAITKI